MNFRSALLILIIPSLFGADFQTGQAARAVLGQPSFTSHEAGVRVQSMTIAGSNLFAADSSQQLLTFDLSKVPAPYADFARVPAAGCALCIFAPTATMHEPVLAGIAAAAHWGKSVAVVDSSRRRVLIWRDASAPRAIRGPDVILGESGEFAPIGPATLVRPVSVAIDGKRIFVGDAALHRVLVWNTIPVTGSQPADAVLGQPDFSSAIAPESPTPGSLAIPQALASDGENLFVADPVSQRILVFSPADSPLESRSVLNSASLQPGPAAPGALITLSGNRLSDFSEDADSTAAAPLPKRLGNTEVILDGEALPLLVVSPTQIQAQIPYELDGRSAASLYIRSERAGGNVTVTAPLTIRLVAANPGLFAVGETEPRDGIVLHAGGEVKGSGEEPVTGDSPATGGEVVTVWAGGLGEILDGDGGVTAVAGIPFTGPPALTANLVTARVNGQDAQVISAVLPKSALGVYQVKILVPPSHDVLGHLSISQNGWTSNTVTFPLKPR